MTGKVAFITGGARGQGRSHAVALAEEGADVVVVDICRDIPGVPYPMATREELDETVALVTATGRRCLGFEVDVRDGARLRDVVDEAVEALGRLDTVIINHGIGLLYKIDHPDAERFWNLVMETNLSAVWRTVHATVPHLRANGGSIVATASVNGLVPQYNLTAYTASKHGVVGLVKALAVELAPQGIRVNAVCPTTCATPMILNEHVLEAATGAADGPIDELKWPMMTQNVMSVPWIEPEDVSKAVVFLASEDARYITGTALPVDAGSTVQPPGLPPFVWNRLGQLGHTNAGAAETVP